MLPLIPILFGLGAVGGISFLSGCGSQPTGEGEGPDPTGDGNDEDKGAEDGDSYVLGNRPPLLPRFRDYDQDGYSRSQGDCNNQDNTIYPGAADDTANGIDNDCDGEIDEDYVAGVCDGKTGLAFGPNALQLEGEVAGDAEDGMRVTSGDFNGDGVNDLAVGIPGHSASSYFDGRVYVFFGGATFNGSTPLSLGAADVIYTGGADFWYLGNALAAADLDQDGKSELLMTAGFEDEGYGAVIAKYNVDTDGSIDFHGVDPASPVAQTSYNLALIKTNPTDLIPEEIHVIGDVDEVGGPGEIVVGSNNKCYVVPVQPFTGTTEDIANIKAYEIHDSQPGSQVCNDLTSGDVDGDGLSELLLGDAYDYYNETGKAYVVKGGTLSSSFVLNTANVTDSSSWGVLSGTVIGDNAGTAVAMGDIDGDGLADAFMTAIGKDNGHLDSGGIYKIAGSSFSSLYGTTTSVGVGPLSLAGSAAVFGDEASAEVATGLAVVRDEECGFSSLMVGAAYYDDSDRLFQLNDDTLASVEGIENVEIDINDDEFIEANESGFGQKVYAIGDVSGDGVPDIAVPAEGTDRVHVFLGERI